MNQRIKAVILSLFQLVCITATYAVAPDSYPFTSAEDAARFDGLTKEIRCVVCQNQSIADSNAPLAKDLRLKIYNMVTEKKSDTDIENYLVQRYGDFILLKPRLNKLTAFLWIFPFAGLSLIFLFLFRFVANQHKKSK